jgi:hypothetical protein
MYALNGFVGALLSISCVFIVSLVPTDASSKMNSLPRGRHGEGDLDELTSYLSGLLGEELLI